LDLFGLPNDRMIEEAPRSWDRVSRRMADVRLLHELYGEIQPLSLAEGLHRTAHWLYQTKRIGLAPR